MTTVSHFPDLFKGESWRKAYQTGFDEAMKACGDCRKCYGKGYATVSEHASGSDEWTGKKYDWKLNPISPCSCDRGKQIKQIMLCPCK